MDRRTKDQYEGTILVVFNGVEEKTVCRGGWSGEGAIASGEDCRNVVHAHVATADVEHASDKIAHHVMKETVAAHAIDEEVEAIDGLFVPGRGVDGADGRSRLVLNGDLLV